MDTLLTYFVSEISTKLRAVRYYLAGTPDFLTSCPSLVYIADMHGLYKSKYPLLIKKTSFELFLSVSPASQP